MSRSSHLSSNSSKLLVKKLERGFCLKLLANILDNEGDSNTNVGLDIVSGLVVPAYQFSDQLGRMLVFYLSD